MGGQVHARQVAGVLALHTQGFGLGRVTGVQIADGRTLPCSACVFNGDPAALTEGRMGSAAAAALARSATQPRSLSALVWAFASEAQGPKAPDLIHHNLFFTEDPAREFGPIGQGRMPEAPTLYLCAEDRARGPATGPATGPERFEIILNAPAGLPALRPEDFRQCRQITFDRLSRMGLHLTAPGPEALTTPATLDRLFPASQGAIYGRSPEGTMASFQRPPARTALPGLYLAGGSVHPGPGIPMATMSGRIAAARLLADMRRRLDAIAAAGRALPRRPRVFFEEWDEPIITGIAWVGELVRIAGGEDVFPELSVQPLAKARILADGDVVVARAPDIILGSWCGKKFRPQQVAARPGWSAIPAVRDGELHEIKSPLILQPGPAALTDGLDALHAIVARWALRG